MNPSSGERLPCSARWPIQIPSVIVGTSGLPVLTINIGVSKSKLHRSMKKWGFLLFLRGKFRNTGIGQTWQSSKNNRDETQSERSRSRVRQNAGEVGDNILTRLLAKTATGSAT